MEEIKFWQDKKEKTIDPTLYSTRAETLAKKIRDETKNAWKANKRTQIRKFYDEVVGLNMAAKRNQKWETVLPLVHMLMAKTAYANGRGLVTEGFVDFMRNSVTQIEEKEDLNIFANFFEAFMGFYTLHGPRN